MSGSQLISVMPSYGRCKSPIRYEDLKECVSAELKLRRSKFCRNGYADARWGRADLYGTTGAINCFAILGLPLGGLRERKRWARQVLRHQKRDGTFPGSNGPEHALGMAIQALNILGAPIPKRIGPLAPTDPMAFRHFLEDLDWTSTHKQLWGTSVPLVAGNRVSSEWVHVLDRFLRASSECEKAAIYKTGGSPPAKTISSIYHILAIYDAGHITYPNSFELLCILLDLKWHDMRMGTEKTQCTDGDWAWLLVELCKLHPEYAGDALHQITSVCEQRCREWNDGRICFVSLSTHHIYCYLWVTARLQAIMRSSVMGGMLWDTLNSHHLFRI